MDWIKDFDLFLFDFDGLLVNTELLHYEAYKKMCRNRGFELTWDFNQYIQIAHYSSEGLANRVYFEFPKLKEMEADWSILYKEKKDALIQMYHEQLIPLMPGVEAFINYLYQNQKKMAVVTNSDNELVNIIKSKDPLLNKIKDWITREKYKKAKPDSECYNYAIELLGNKKDRVVGFEDTPRGIRALLGTKATPVLISTIPYPEIADLKKEGVYVFKSFEDILNFNGHPISEINR